MLNLVYNLKHIKMKKIFFSMCMGVGDSLGIQLKAKEVLVRKGLGITG